MSICSLVILPGWHSRLVQKRNRLLLLIALGIVALAVAYGFARQTQPSYQGRTLWEWLEKYCDDRQIYPMYPGDRGDLLRAEDTRALRAIGTNAIPYLLKWIQKDPGRSPASAFLLKHVPYRVYRSPAGRWLGDKTYWSESLFAAYGFELLGTNAAPAVPELTKLASDPTRPETAARASRALALIASEGASKATSE